MEALIVIGFIVFIGWLVKEWAFQTRMNGQIDKMVKDNSKKIMDEINKNK